MHCETIRFSPYKRLKLHTYLNEWTTRPCVWPRRQAVIVLPGGGLQLHTVSEGEPVAMAFAAAGYQAFVLDYRVGKECVYPNGLEDIGLALRYIRSRAGEWNIDPDKIILCGFSSGGGLAMDMCAKWNDPEVQQLCGLEGLGDADTTLKPYAVILGYSVSIVELSGSNDMQRLFRGDRTQEDMAYLLDVDRLAGPHLVPAFIWHTFYDQLVPVEHSLRVAGALARYDIPFELHIFTNGGHGGGLFTQATALGDESRISAHNAEWFPLCLRWMNDLLGAPMEPMAQAPIPGESPRAHVGHDIPQLTNYVSLTT